MSSACKRRCSACCALTFGVPLCAHITNGPDGQEFVTKQHRAQTNIHREFRPILMLPLSWSSAPIARVRGMAKYSFQGVTCRAY